MSDTYRLQLRHGAEIQDFSTRDKVTAYIKGQLEYAKVSLLPYEPILFFYGEGGEKNAMIMVGLPEGQNHDGNSFFVVDTAELQEEIDNMGSKYDEVIEELKAEDEKLEKAIKEEEESRKAADEAEENARIEADEKEANERQTADEAEAKARSEKDAELEQAIVEEAETRANKDEELQESIDFTNDDLQSVIKACGLIYNEMLSSDRVNYVPDLHDEIIRDSESLSDAVDKISKFVAKLGQDLKFKVENTDTVNLSLESNEKDGGNILSADVNIAGVDGLSKSTFDNNILGKTSDGLYAAASIVPSTKNPNVLIFKTSGYVDGKFKVDAYETEVELTAYKGDTGKETGVNVSVDSNENKIYAELNLSSNKNNILKLEDGEYVVEGTSKNIKYKDTTVFAALKDHETHIEELEDTIEFVKAVDVKPSETETVITTVDKSSKGDFVVGANVKLSSDKSIIVANGGLKADVSATFKKGTSTLTIYVGNNTYDIDLSDLAVSVLKSATYDASNEELVLEFIVGDTTKTVRVPVGTLIHDIEVDDTDTVDMTLKSVSGGPNHISAEVKVDKSHSDNILTVTSNGLYVSKAYITDAVSVETTERKEADKELKSKLDEVSALAQTNKENLAEEISRANAAEQNNAKDIAQEIKDARAAEKANADAIAENKVAISENAKAIADETLRALNAEEANADAIVAEKERAIKAESDNANAIKSEVDRAVEKEADLLNRIGDNDVKIKENKDVIASEVSRATNAEQELNNKATELATNLANEVSRASAAEAKNANDISNEVSRATTAEGVLEGKVSKNTADIEANSNAIATESTRATAAEGKLTTDLTEEITRAQAADQANAQAVVAEKERALSAEGVLEGNIAKNAEGVLTNATAITAEANRAKSAEAELFASINDEATRATAAESKLTTDLSNEVIRAKAAEETNADAIAAEKERALSAEGVLDGRVLQNESNITANTAAITSEATRAQGAEATLTTNLTDEITRAKAAEEANKTAIDKEISDARKAEQVLDEKVTSNSSAISIEVNRAKDAEAYLLSNVNAEATRAQGVESELTTKLTEEVGRAKAAEKANSDAVASEKARAEEKETDLLEKINKNTEDIAAISTEVGDIELVKEGDLSYALYVNGTKHGEFTIPKDQFLKSVNYNASTKELVFVFNTTDGEVTTTISIADLVDTYEAGDGLVLNGNVFSVDLAKVASVDFVNNAVNTETLRATSAEEKNAKAVSDEEKRALVAEGVLDGKVEKNTTDIANTKAVADKVSADLASEITRATKAEEANATAVLNESARAAEKETDLANAINETNTTLTTVSTKVDNVVLDVNTLGTSLENEVSRAKGAEAELSTKVDKNTDGVAKNSTAITNEVVRAKDAEAELTSELGKEITRAKAAEGENKTAIESEATRATTAEGVIEGKVSKNTTDIALNASAITDEASRAKAAESKLTTDLTEEITRAKAAEEANALAVSSEQNRATTAEAELSAKVAKNVTDIEKVNEVANKVSSDLTNEVTRAQVAEATITSNLTSEINRASEAESTLRTDIDKNTTAITTNASAIAVEESRAKGAEAELLAEVTTEITRAQVEEGKLSERLTEEVTRAKAAEEANALAVSTEQNRAEHVEADLLEKITKNTSDIAAISTEVGNIELVKEGDLTYALYVNGVKHGEVVIPKDQFLKQVSYDSTTKELVFVFNTTTGEVTTRVSIGEMVSTYVAGDGLVLNGNVFSLDYTKVATVDAINTAVSNETLRAKAQEEHITSLINSEVERAKAKEDLLKSDIVDVKSVISDVEASVDTNKTEISTLKTKLESEIVRATAAEKLNSDAIDAEKGRAQGEEKRLENSISINARQIEVIHTSISDERLRAIEKEGELSLAIANEASRAQLKENELDGKVASEVERARQAEASLDTKISDQKTYTDSVKSELVDSIELVKVSVSDTKAELTTSINNKANSSDVYTKSETTELFDGYAKTSEIQSQLNEKLNVTDAQYTYATKDSVQEIKSTYATLDDLNNVNTQLSNRIDSNEDSIDNINLTYNTATSELVYTDKKGLMHTYKLYSGSLIKKGEFDPKTNSIVLTIENGGVESQITIPVSELLSDLSDKIDANSSKIEALKDALNKLANKWTTTSSSTVDLNKTTSGDVDILTADVRVASSNKQAIVSTGGGLYVSNDLEDYTCVFGSEGTITGQNAISKLLETTTAIRSEFDNRITNNSNEIERLKTDIANNKSEIANVKSDVQTNKSEISTLKTQVNNNTVEIQTVKERFNTLDTKVGSLETRLVTAETTINNLNTKVTNLETELNTVKNSLSQQDGKITNLETTIQSLQTLVNSLINGSLKDLTDEIAKINNVTGYSTYSNTKNIPSRLDDLEGDTTDLYGEITTIKTDLIGTPDSTNDGSVWSELNNMVDAGTY